MQQIQMGVIDHERKKKVNGRLKGKHGFTCLLHHLEMDLLAKGSSLCVSTVQEWNGLEAQRSE
jgi:hypothetical protein